MKIAKFYAVTWVVVAVAALGVYTGNSFNPLNATLLAFLAFALFLAGVFGVLPVMLKEYRARKQRIELSRLKR